MDFERIKLFINLLIGLLILVPRHLLSFAPLVCFDNTSVLFVSLKVYPVVYPPLCLQGSHHLRLSSTSLQAF